MRQWHGVPPRVLCRRHLLGEHVEQHMFAGVIARGRRVSEYIARGLIDPGRVRERHDRCAREMVRRGYRHESPIEYLDPAPLHNQSAYEHARDLIDRCPECAARMRREQA